VREKERSKPLAGEAKGRGGARARIMYADCNSAIMSLSRVYVHPQHRRSRSVSTVDLRPFPSPLPPRPASLFLRREKPSGRPSVHNAAYAIHSCGKRTAMVR